MSKVIDADTHIIETEAIWDYFDEELCSRKPTLVRFSDPELGGRERTLWVIDGHLVPKPHGRGGQALRTPPIDAEEAADPDWQVRAMSDVDTRLREATAMGVDVQVVYPTIFIAYLTDDVALEVGLCRAYNRFMADTCGKDAERLRWVIVPPLRDLDKTIEELHFGKQHGAVGVMFRGVEKDRSLADPYFFPVYEEASKLGLPVCVHTGPGSPVMTELFDDHFSNVFPQVRLLPVMAFQDLLFKKVPDKFPDLRIGFVEAAASWVPYLFHYLNRRMKTGRDYWGPHTFRDNRMYVACESDEDLPYLLTCIGEDNMISGSDYGHTDQSADMGLIQTLRARTDVSPQVLDKILCTNPARFYGI